MHIKNTSSHPPLHPLTSPTTQKEKGYSDENADCGLMDCNIMSSRLLPALQKMCDYNFQDQPKTQ